MNSIKGPAIFLAQFFRDQSPFHHIDALSDWVASLGYKGVQIPTWDSRAMDLEKASESKSYCQEFQARLKEKGIEIAELSAHLQGQVMAIHPAYEDLFQPFYPKGLKDKARVKWASDRIRDVIKVSSRLGLSNVSVLSGGLAWLSMYPWPQRPHGLIEEAFDELGKRWLPVLDFASEHGVTLGFELHPGSDLFDGATYEMFLDRVKGHPAACLTYDPSHFLLQQLDYLQFIDLYQERIRGFHVKDAEFRPNGRVGVYGGYQSWTGRAGRFRSLGDGQVDFVQVFSKLTQYGYRNWAILEWECCLKSPEQGAAEGAGFIRKHLIQATSTAFDDFAGGTGGTEGNRKFLGLDGTNSA